MDDERDDAARGRSFLIFVAVGLVIAVSIAAAWFTMGDGSTEASATKVLDDRVVSTTTALAPRSSDPAKAEATRSTTTTPTTTTGPITSTGRFVQAEGTGQMRGNGEVHTYTVEAEEGSGVDPDELAAVVDVILADQRGWTSKGYAFMRVPAGGTFTISLATPATADDICLPLHTNGKFSCHEGHRVVLNLTRWNEGTTDLPLDLNGYRAQVVNHEVGHELGLDHVGCGGAGLYAPVMMQQSKGLDGCVANPWPTLDYAAPR